MSVIKQWEDGDDLIARTYETAKIVVTGKIRLLDRGFEADFGAAEIKTFCVPHDPAQPVIGTNRLEWIDEWIEDAAISHKQEIMLFGSKTSFDRSKKWGRFTLLGRSM